MNWKRSNYRCQNFDHQNWLFLIEIKFGGPHICCLLCWIFRKFLRNCIWQSTPFKKVATLHTAAFLKANFVVDIFLRILNNFQNIDNIFWKLHVFKINPLSASFTKWSITLKQFVDKLPTNCLSVFDHFVGFALKGLTWFSLS